MKKMSIQLIIIFSFINGFAQTHLFSVTNPLAITRKNELIELKRTDIEKHTGKTAGDSHYQINSNKKEIKFQTVDVNNDGSWDELVFLSSFAPKEKETFTITKVINQKFVRKDTAPALAHVRMKPKNADGSFGESITHATMPYQNPPTDFSKEKLPAFLTEGPGWENDKVAFRLYFDIRNTIDIYGKRIPAMVMDTVGANPANSYHNLSAWGMDILHVAKSLGAGSPAIETKDENGKDTLIRLGGSHIIKETYRQLADGPLYAAFEMNYEWKINDKPVTVKQMISIWGNQYFYDSRVTVTGISAGAKLVTGIADFYDNEVDHFYLDKTGVLLSHGKQSENKDELGLAIVVPRHSFASFSEAPKTNSDITETHLIAQPIKNNEPLLYRFYTCWEKTDSRFATAAYFKNYMKAEAKKYGAPLYINW